MDSVTQLYSYRWNTREFPICTLNIRMQALADSLNLKIETWQEDGLGDAAGFMCQSKSGLAIYAVELSHAVAHLHEKGPVIYVEAGEIAENGVNAILFSTLNALSLTIENTEWVQPAEGQEYAQEAVDFIKKYREERQG